MHHFEDAIVHDAVGPAHLLAVLRDHEVGALVAPPLGEGAADMVGRQGLLQRAGVGDGLFQPGVLVLRLGGRLQ
eukprot:13180620-Alexandrium_andersonii.AAC.1